MIGEAFRNIGNFVRIEAEPLSVVYQRDAERLAETVRRVQEIGERYDPKKLSIKQRINVYAVFIDAMSLKEREVPRGRTLIFGERIRIPLPSRKYRSQFRNHVFTRVKNF